MSSILEETHYEKKIGFFRDRLQTCGYRFYKMIQTRKKEAPRLLSQEANEELQQDVQNKVLHSTDDYINCLRGEHYSQQIPAYLVHEANDFKTLVYTHLAPKYVLEQQRSHVLQKIFEVEFNK